MAKTQAAPAPAPVQVNNSDPNSPDLELDSELIARALGEQLWHDHVAGRSISHYRSLGHLLEDLLPDGLEEWLLRSVLGACQSWHRWAWRIQAVHLIPHLPVVRGVLEVLLTTPPDADGFGVSRVTDIDLTDEPVTLEAMVSLCQRILAEYRTLYAHPAYEAWEKAVQAASQADGQPDDHPGFVAICPKGALLEGPR
jgi:hypothetical protein